MTPRYPHLQCRRQRQLHGNGHEAWLAYLLRSCRKLPSSALAAPKHASILCKEQRVRRAAGHTQDRLPLQPFHLHTVHRTAQDTGLLELNILTQVLKEQCRIRTAADWPWLSRWPVLSRNRHEQARTLQSILPKPSNNLGTNLAR